MPRAGTPRNRREQLPYYRVRMCQCVWCGVTAWCHMLMPRKRYERHVPMLLCGQCEEKLKREETEKRNRLSKMCSPSSQAVSLRHSVHLAKETSPSAKTGYAQYRTSHETWQAHPCSSHSPYFTPCCRRYAITSCLCSGLNQYCFPLRKGTINADNSPLSILGSNQSLVSPCAFAKSRIVR